ncbi:hypothetical protein R1flu_029086 [Riccia fluitans]|uniref:Uncharacterized protein n=1 Tax=Riccia fluitans TaxID=41844 RepID=A0ABD1XSL6_9MARC
MVDLPEYSSLKRTKIDEEDTMIAAHNSSISNPRKLAELLPSAEQMKAWQGATGTSGKEKNLSYPLALHPRGEEQKEGAIGGHVCSPMSAVTEMEISDFFVCIDIRLDYGHVVETGAHTSSVHTSSTESMDGCRKVMFTFLQPPIPLVEEEYAGRILKEKVFASISP